MSEWRRAMVEAATAIREAERLVTMGHVGPDGDALGAILALALAARSAGKHAVATYGEPFVLADRYRYLDTSTLVHPKDVEGSFDVAVACDCGTAQRLGSALGHATAADRLVVVDHHVSNDGFGDIRVIDSTAAATTQLVFYLLEELAWEITKPVADALYTGLVTDTGRFQYSNTTSEVHRIASILLDHGVEPDVVGQHVYEEAPFGFLSVAGAVMSRARLDEDVALVWSMLHMDDLADADIAYEEADGLIDMIRVTDKAQVACLLREMSGGKLKGSLRSRGRVDVAAIASEIGGGGHHNAAGFTTTMSPEETIAFLQDRL